MNTCDITRNNTPKFIFCSKKGTLKMAHPVPAYMIVTPPPGRAIDLKGAGSGNVNKLLSKRQFSSIFDSQ